MIKVDVTEYKNQNKKAGFSYYGSFSVRDGFIVADGDEAFYRFIGANSCYPVTELIHPDDVSEFLEAVDKLPNGDRNLIIRMMNADGEYKMLSAQLKLNGRNVGNFLSFTVEYCEFMEVKDKFHEYMYNMSKYREFMSLSPLMFFEYSFESGRFLIYRYVNQKGQRLINGQLDEFIQETMDSDELDDYAKSDFMVLCDFLKKGADRFEMTVDADVFDREDKEGRYQFKGITLYDKRKKAQTIGTVSLIDTKLSKKSYYLTDGAFDPGTGVLNKKAINEYIMENIKHGKSFCLCIIDVDDFKKINDGFGHMFGDQVLSNVAEILKSVIGPRGMVGRFGGDEFIAVVEGQRTEKDIRLILKTVSKHILWDYDDIKDSVRISTSIGVSRFPEDADNYETLFKKADKSLYIAKAKGKNRFIIYDKAKHGDVENADETSEERERLSGIKVVASDEKKMTVISDIIIALKRDGAKAIPESIKLLRSYFDIDGIAVYKGYEMKRIMSFGKYVNPVEKLNWINDKAFMELFDAGGVYSENTINRLSNILPEAYRMYELQENKKFIHFMAQKDGVPLAVISFDYFNRSPKAGVADMGMMRIAGRLMADIVMEME